MAKIWKYVELTSLEEAGPNENVCASYPSPIKNVSGKKNDEKMLAAQEDAKAGKCRLLVWRKVCYEDPLIDSNASNLKVPESLQVLLDEVEKLGWKYTLYPEKGDLSCVELENFSPHGEDLVYDITLFNEYKASSFVDGLWNAYDSFDPNEHAEDLVVAKKIGGKKGIPSIHVLVKDADDINDMLQTLWYKVNVAHEAYLNKKMEAKT